MSEYIRVGLDVHVESVTAAILEGNARDAEVVRLGGDLHKVRRLFRRLSRRGRCVRAARRRVRASCCTGG